MDMEFKHGRMEIGMKDNGKINDTEKVRISTQMEQEEKQNTRMEHALDGLQPDDIKSGRLVNLSILVFAVKSLFML